MSYCLLRQDSRPEFWRSTRVRFSGLERLFAALPIDDIQEPVRVALSPYGVLPSDLLELPCLILSDAARRVFDRVRVDNIQYFRAELQVEYSRKLITDYWIANVIGAVACVDRETAHFEPSADDEDGELRAFQIAPALTYDFDIFRLAEDRRLVAISARVRAALEQANLRGLLFQDTTTYDGYAATSARREPSPEDSA